MGRGRGAGATDWAHVRLHPLTFEGLAIVGGNTGASSETVSTSESAELWVGLARAALSVDEAAGAAAESPEPSTIGACDR